jgi:hypothetical protein
MCRNIRPLYHIDPPATSEEIEAAALQFVRKISGYTKPSKANQPVFDKATAEIAASLNVLLDSLVTNAPKRTRA